MAPSPLPVTVRVLSTSEPTPFADITTAQRRKCSQQARLSGKTVSLTAARGPGNPVCPAMSVSGSVEGESQTSSVGWSGATLGEHLP